MTESRRCSIGDDFALRKLRPDCVTLSADEQKAARKDIRQCYLVYCFLKGSDGCGFGKLKEDPDNNQDWLRNDRPFSIFTVMRQLPSRSTDVCLALK